MIQHYEFKLTAKRRGCHLITQEILNHLPTLPASGLLHLFSKHTSAALCINENADPDVRTDLNQVLNHLVKERESYYTHTFEGDDDMPAHAKSSIIGASISIPIINSQLGLGTWQGVYLCEFRNYGGDRNIIATIIS